MPRVRVACEKKQSQVFALSLYLYLMRAKQTMAPDLGLGFSFVGRGLRNFALQSQRMTAEWPLLIQ